MRVAFVSDIHANRQAWNAVLLDLRAERVDRIVCLGDIVGYGPSPAEVFESAHASIHDCLLGNHDAAFCGKLDDALFSDEARLALAWSRKRLGRAAAAFCASMPLALAGPGFRCAHGDFSAPGQFHYVQEAADALPSWRAVPEPLLFLGHTHRSALFVIGASGTPHLLAPQDFALEPGKRYLVNPGSVGLPREADPRAAYCIYDDAVHAVFFRRVPFDLDGFRADLDRAGLANTLDWFLKRDPRAGAPVLRAVTGFRPPGDPEAGVRDTEAVRELGALRRQTRSWRRLAVLALAILAIAGLLVGGFVRHLAHRALRLDDQPQPGWSILLGNRYRQSVSCHSTPEGPMLRITSSDAASEVRVASIPVHLVNQSAVTIEARFRKSPDFTGAVALTAPLVRDADAGPETLDQFLVKEPNQPRKDGWLYARKSAPLPARAREIHLEIRGRFRGAVEVADLSLSTR